MANNPQHPDGYQDPAGSTQMFRAFVDEGAQQRPAAGPSTGGTNGTGGSAGPRVGLILGLIAVVAVVAAVAWLALS
ncbi:hypothetical protein RKE29_07405 [Streptomyces sp. B1866]|uniref:hypothetical protein n=1 Tax=Streptomyces sp. B1866 TaxID=3075431 RepID=UPI00288CE64E|nr:hypothetical protein [Streptomyces sp. B1866]MDT3396468.1 hypothetical protein [Streptomyces sp. B1866]